MAANCFAVSLFVSCIVGRSMASIMRSSSVDRTPSDLRSDRRVSCMPEARSLVRLRSRCWRSCARRRAAALRRSRILFARSTITLASAAFPLAEDGSIDVPLRISAALTMAEHTSDAS